MEMLKEQGYKVRWSYDNSADSNCFLIYINELWAFSLFYNNYYDMRIGDILGVFGFRDSVYDPEICTKLINFIRSSIYFRPNNPA